VNFPFMKNEEIDSAANRLRFEALGTRAREVFIDLDAIVYDYLCERDALSVDDEAELPDEDGDEVLGKTFIKPGRILVNRRLKTSRDQGRYRFTLAHEIGHWILHRPLILAVIDQPSLFSELAGVESLTTLNRSVTSPRPPRHEIQANRFASGLLIDHDLLRDHFRARFGAGGGAGSSSSSATELPPRALARHLASQAIGPLPPLAGVFGVSVEAMAIALESRGFLPGETPLFGS